MLKKAKSIETAPDFRNLFALQLAESKIIKSKKFNARVSMRVARGSASLLPSHGRGVWPRDVLKKVSRGLSRVEAGTLASISDLAASTDAARREGEGARVP